MSYDELKAALTNGSGIVELSEVRSQAIANTASAAAAAARDHRESIERRECVAYLYTKEYDAECAARGLPRAAAVEIPVTLEQARELLSLGATWVGAEAHRP